MRREITAACLRLKSTSSKRSRLLSTFHKQRTNPKGYMIVAWTTLMKDLELDMGSDSFFMHAVLKKIFEDCMQEYLVGHLLVQYRLKLC